MKKVFYIAVLVICIGYFTIAYMLQHVFMSNSTGQAEPDFSRVLPAQVCSEIEVIDQDSYIAPGDRYELYFCRVPSHLRDDMTRFFSTAKDWKPLPLTDDEYNTYIKGCGGWPFADYDDLSEYGLTHADCRGFWHYSGDYDPNEREPYCYFGSQEIMLYIEERDIFIYAYSHE